MPESAENTMVTEPNGIALFRDWSLLEIKKSPKIDLF
jgi:hypothetical protein